MTGRSERYRISVSFGDDEDVMVAIMKQYQSLDARRRSLWIKQVMAVGFGALLKGNASFVAGQPNGSVAGASLAIPPSIGTVPANHDQPVSAEAKPPSEVTRRGLKGLLGSSTT